MNLNPAAILSDGCDDIGNIASYWWHTFMWIPSRIHRPKLHGLYWLYLSVKKVGDHSPSQLPYHSLCSPSMVTVFVLLSPEVEYWCY